jgi:hypothetical protein
MEPEGCRGYWISQQDLAREPAWPGDQRRAAGRAPFSHLRGWLGSIAHYLLKELVPGTDPLGPDNVLIFAAGPLTSTSVQTCMQQQKEN